MRPGHIADASSAHAVGRLVVVAGALCILLASPVRAQSGPTTPSVGRALARIKADNAWTLDQQQSICEIPAPPFKESVRGAEYKRRLEALGLTVRVDSIGNVIAERKGVGTGPTVMLAGHLDTVFPEGTDVKVKREGTVMRAPGIGDDCRGLAVVLAVARAFQMEKVPTAGTVIFVGYTRQALEPYCDAMGPIAILGNDRNIRNEAFESTISVCNVMKVTSGALRAGLSRLD